MDFARLDGERLTLVFALENGGAADCVYLGARLPEGEDLAALTAATTRGRHESQPDIAPRPGLLPERKGGWSGTPALDLRRDGAVIDTDCRLAGWERADDGILLRFTDPQAGIAVTIAWQIGAGDVVTASTSLTNTAATPLPTG